MKRHTFLSVVVLVAALAIAAGTGSGSAAQAKGNRLQAFGSCGELLGHLRRQALPLVGPYGLGGQAIALGRAGMPGVVAAPAASESAKDSGVAGVDFSGTNVQEEGIDEPDLVKTDGASIFAVNGSILRAVDVSTGRPKLADSLRLPEGWQHELLLRGNRLLVLSRGGGWIEPVPGLARTSFMPISAGSTLTEVDVRNTSALKIVRTMKLDGEYVSARLTEGTARIVVSSAMPQELPFKQPVDPNAPASTTEATTRNRAVVRDSGLKGWLPGYTLTDKRRRTTESHALVQCRNVRRPASFAGLGMLTVLTLDLDQGLEPIDSDAIVADGRIVYASLDSLYVATERWADRPVSNAGGEVAGGHDCDPQVRHQRPGADALPGERPGHGCPAQPVVAVRAPGRAPSREHRHADVVEPRLAARERELRHRAARGRPAS